MKLLLLNLSFFSTLIPGIRYHNQSALATSRWLSQTWAALKLSSPNFIEQICLDVNQLLGRSTAPSHPQADTIAMVRKSANLAPDETKFLAQHQHYRTKHLAKFLGTTPPRDLKIALCCSGGGYRAMIYTLGALIGLARIGLLPAITYASALSGSTWCLGAYLSSTNTLTQLRAHLKASTQTNFYKFYRLDQLVDQYLQSLILKQHGSLVLIWSALLADKILEHLGENKFFTCLSDQRYYAEHCTYLLPIYTAVEPFLIRTIKPHRYQYHWLEFTPYEVGYVQESYRIPTWSFGRKFDHGVSCDFNPELPFAYLMGIFGSAFTINLHELLQFMRSTPAAAISNSAPNHALLTNLQALTTKFTSIDLEHVRLLPARLPNFRYGLPKMPALELPQPLLPDNLQMLTTLSRRWLNLLTLQPVLQSCSKQLLNQQLVQQANITLIDAGIAFNLPLPPLLNQQRQIDLILIIDSSAGLPQTQDLTKALQYAKQYYGWAYRKTTLIPADRQISATAPETVTLRNRPTTQPPAPKLANFTLYTCPEQPNAPAIVYLPAVNNLGNFDFDIEKCTKIGRCQTSNFQYREIDFENLCQLGELNMVDCQSKLKMVLTQLLERKTGQIS